MKKVKKESKSEKVSKPANENKTRKTKIAQNVPGEEAIREKALEIYYQRTERGEEGTALNDWLLAEEWLKES